MVAAGAFLWKRIRVASCAAVRPPIIRLAGSHLGEGCEPGVASVKILFSEHKAEVETCFGYWAGGVSSEKTGG